MTGYAQCHNCEAEFRGALRCDEDGHPFVETTDCLHDCAICGAECCRECSKRCAGCHQRLCPSCQVQTDEGKMCSACSAEYMVQEVA